jgi:hypothetical protein
VRLNKIALVAIAEADAQLFLEIPSTTENVVNTKNKLIGQIGESTRKVDVFRIANEYIMCLIKIAKKNPEARSKPGNDWGIKYKPVNAVICLSNVGKSGIENIKIDREIALDESIPIENIRKKHITEKFTLPLNKICVLFISTPADAIIKKRRVRPFKTISQLKFTFLNCI